MSIYDTQDIAKWEAKNKMSCIYCIHYKGLNEPCNRGMTVLNLNESLTCEHYKYNQELLYDNNSD